MGKQSFEFDSALVVSVVVVVVVVVVVDYTRLDSFQCFCHENMETYGENSHHMTGLTDLPRMLLGNDLPFGVLEFVPVLV